MAFSPAAVSAEVVSGKSLIRFRRERVEIQGAGIRIEFFVIR
jgi:hypothetical protein